MNLQIFKRMKKRDLLKYLEFLLREYRVVDSFWFLGVEELYGPESVEKINGKVWAQMGGQTGYSVEKSF